MVQLTITAEESAILRNILHSYLMDLRMEICGTERLSMREDLKKVEAFLKDMLSRLPEPQPAAV